MSLEEVPERKILAEAISREESPRSSLLLIMSMGLGINDLSNAVGIQSTALEEWVAIGRPLDLEGRQKTAIDRVKRVSAFCLSKGFLSPDNVGAWLSEPNDDLNMRTPLDTLATEDGEEAVLMASTTFTRPDPV